MNNTNFFFTLVFFFSFGFVSQAQVEINVPIMEGTTFTVNNDVQELTQAEEVIEIESTTESNTTSNTESNITTADSATYAFYFNHKQFMRPILRKSALC
jgi:hypothetical protein